MRPRILATAAFSAAFSAVLAHAADPLPLPPVVGKTAPTSPTVPVPNAKPIAPTQLPMFRPLEKSEVQEKTEVPKKLPVTPDAAPTPRTSDGPATAPAPAVESHVETFSMPRETKIHDDHLGPWNTVWVRGGYNYLWIKEAPASVPLLTTDGQVVSGNTTTSYGAFSGFSVDGGVWLNERHTLGIGAAGFMGEKRSTVTAFSSDAAGAPSYRRPFFNAQIGGANAADAFIVSAPSQFAGSFAYEQGARTSGFEVYGLMNVAHSERWTTNFSLGFRYFDLDEYATAYQVTQSLTGNTIPFFGQGMVSSVAITDRTRTRNQFFGGQFGGDVEYRYGMFFADLGVKAALGPVHQITEVEGRTEVPGGASGPGGFLAVGSVPNGNQGRLSTNNFAVLADVNGLVGIQVSQSLRIGVGYQFLYLNNVARPSSQWVSSIDPRLIPTSSSFGGRTSSSTLNGGPGTPPNSPFDRDDFFLHGLRFLVELQF